MVREEYLIDAVIKMIRHGGRHIVGPADFVAIPQIRASYASLPERYLLTTPSSDMDPLELAQRHPRVPTVIVFAEGSRLRAQYFGHDSRLPPRLLLAPANGPDPVYPNRAIGDVRSAHRTLDEILRTL